jgi:hypothetical protein
MPRTASRITQADVARVLRAVDQTGVNMEVVIEVDGRIRVVPHLANRDVDRTQKAGPQPKKWD